MNKISDLRIAKDMKYTALYWAMKFNDTVTPDNYQKQYLNHTVLIRANEREVYVDGQLLFNLNDHVDFVLLELLNRFFDLGYKLSDLKFDQDVIIFRNFRIKLFSWDEALAIPEHNWFVFYKSRLMSGILEYQSKIVYDNDVFDYGLFINPDQQFNLTKKTNVFTNDSNFEFDGDKLIKYKGSESIVFIPKGTKSLESALFWDNQNIEEVILPDTVEDLGGDTFYKCKNLKKIVIPSSVKVMGNNPFAGCVQLKLINKSPFFIYQNNALYDQTLQNLIYYSIASNENKFVIPHSVKIIGKHAFYLCNRLIEITIPSSVIKLENNPFSGCEQLSLVNQSNFYNIVDDVIYNKEKTSIIGVLNKIVTQKLVLPEGLKTINRNSFWNCKGINEIVFPASLEDIGYNPFVDCTNIKFISFSKNFNVFDDVLYNSDFSKIICYPAWKANGTVYLKNSVKILERGAFSGCTNMTNIELNNVEKINKACFTNCRNLQIIDCPNSVSYIGVWAFAYCESLKTISVSEKTLIDDFAFSNCNAKIIIRESA